MDVPEDDAYSPPPTPPPPPSEKGRPEQAEPMEAEEVEQVLLPGEST